MRFKSVSEWWITAIAVALVVIITFSFIFGPARFVFFALQYDGTAKLGSSSSSQQVPFVAPHPNIWIDITERDVIDVLKYINTVPNNLNLTAAQNATLWDNFVHGIELVRPSKKDAQDFITRTNTVPPERWARVAIHHGTSSEVYWDEYIVGPLPISPKTSIRQLEYPHRTALNHSRTLVPDALSFKIWPYSVAQAISDITQDLLGGTINADGRFDPDGLELSFRDPWVEHGRIIRWCSFQRTGNYADAGTLLPQGLYVKLDTTTRDSANWKVLRWYYNGILYNSTEEFRAAWQSPGFEKDPQTEMETGL
jgi:primary-amine oxidase